VWWWCVVCVCGCRGERESRAVAIAEQAGPPCHERQAAAALASWRARPPAPPAARPAPPCGRQGPRGAPLRGSACVREGAAQKGRAGVAPVTWSPAPVLPAASPRHGSAPRPSSSFAASAPPACWQADISGVTPARRPRCVGGGGRGGGGGGGRCLCQAAAGAGSGACATRAAGRCFGGLSHRRGWAGLWRAICRRGWARAAGGGCWGALPPSSGPQPGPPAAPAAAPAGAPAGGGGAAAVAQQPCPPGCRAGSAHTQRCPPLGWVLRVGRGPAHLHVSALRGKVPHVLALFGAGVDDAGAARQHGLQALHLAAQQGLHEGQLVGPGARGGLLVAHGRTCGSAPYAWSGGGAGADRDMTR
jgi:hypothetical protein